MLDRDTFLSQVAEAFAHLEDREWLATCPLAQLLASGSNNPGESLATQLSSAIKQLRPVGDEPSGSPRSRQYRNLLLRYLVGASPKQIAQELMVSDRQARRDHLDGLQLVGLSLWQRVQRTGKRASGDDTFGLPLPPESGALVPPSALQAIQSEVDRLTAGQTSRPTPVEETVRGVVQTIEHLANSQDITIDVTSSREPCLVAIDHALLRQILLNLLTIQLEAHQQTRLDLEITRHPDRAQIRVAIGCPDALASSVAHHHCPLSSPDPDDPRLAVCYRLLNRYAGSLNPASRETGYHDVALTLPLARTATILLVDDNTDFLRLFERYLSDYPYELYQANTAELALSLARERQPDLITLDVMLPSQDGWEILQALKSDPATREIPVVICSVLPDQALAKSLGAADFVLKPVRQPVLLATIERCLVRSPQSARPDSR
jgi:CheY-like chemotaxis protein